MKYLEEIQRSLLVEDLWRDTRVSGTLQLDHQTVCMLDSAETTPADSEH